MSLHDELADGVECLPPELWVMIFAHFDHARGLRRLRVLNRTCRHFSALIHKHVRAWRDLDELVWNWQWWCTPARIADLMWTLFFDFVIDRLARDDCMLRLAKFLQESSATAHWWDRDRQFISCRCRTCYRDPRCGGRACGPKLDVLCCGSIVEIGVEYHGDIAHTRVIKIDTNKNAFVESKEAPWSWFRFPSNDDPHARKKRKTE